MNEPDTVTVYGFVLTDFWPESTTQPAFKAPRAVILEKYKGEVLEGTGEEVPLQTLDSEGRYRRLTTAWGELQ